MCIIAYVGKGKYISDETIKIMFKGNKDGAGIMYQRNPNDNVKIIKGFMDVDSLIKAFRAIPETAERAIHCRIATAGKISVPCCHPFPVRDSVEKMKNPKDEAPLAFMHNGVISWCNPTGGKNATHSDTMVFGENVLYPLRKLLNGKQVKKLIDKALCGSRLLIFRKGDSPLMFGKWEEDDNGIKYSNGNYKEYVYKGVWDSGCYNNSWFGYSYGDKSKKTTTKEVVKSIMPYDCEWDCDNCEHYDCEWNNTFRLEYSQISVLAHRDDEDRATKEIEDTLFDNGFDVVEWNTIASADGEYLEFFIDVEGLTPFPKTISDIAGYEVAGVWNC